MKLFWRKLLIFISFLLVFSVNLSALDILENYNYGKGAVFLESKGERTITLGKYIRILEDKDRSLNADDIFSGNFDQTFKPTKNDIVNLGLVDTDVWIEFPSIFNYSDTKQWYIIIGNESTTPLKSISFYFLQNNKFVHLVNIPSVKQHQIDTKSPILYIPIPTWILEDNSNSIGKKDLQIYANASFSGRADINISLADTINPSSFYTENFLLVFVLGAIIMLFFYNFFILFALKELTYLFYNLYLFFWVGVSIVGYYKLEVLLGFYMSYFTHLIGSILASICIIEFVNHFLKTKTSIPTGYRWLKALEIIFILLLFTGFQSVIFTYYMNFVFRIIMLFSVFIVGFICFIRGQYYAKFFLIGWFIFLVTTIIWVLCLNGVIQFNFITSYIQILGLVIQTLFLSFALVDRYQLLRKKVLTANDKLKKANAQLIHVFGITVEARDIYTAGHQFRVSGLAEAIAKQMRLDSYFIENVKLSALIHDIGKIVIPKKLLSKKTNLSQEEFQKIQEHVNFGYQIIKDLDVPKTIKDGILHHHERLDGSGYPNGIKKRKISLVGKILAVADTVEAITNARPYRSALGLEKAFDVIKENKSFDKRVVKACFTVFRRGFIFPQVIRTLHG